MYVLVTYDVATSSEGGEGRLRRVARVCLDYGQRVQNSVFECSLDPARYVEMKDRLLRIAKLEEDSIRFYHLGNRWRDRIEHYGVKGGFDIEGFLVI